MQSVELVARHADQRGGGGVLGGVVLVPHVAQLTSEP